jgi:hypothetical protein
MVRTVSEILFVTWRPAHPYEISGPDRLRSRQAASPAAVTATATTSGMSFLWTAAAYARPNASSAPGPSPSSRQSAPRAQEWRAESP